MPMAEKAMKERDHTYTNAYGKERKNRPQMPVAKKKKSKPQMLVANEKWLPYSVKQTADTK